jgi:hypothetical protein
VNGVDGQLAVKLATWEFRLGQGPVTTQHQPMEELIAQETALKLSMHYVSVHGVQVEAYNQILYVSVHGVQVLAGM